MESVLVVKMMQTQRSSDGSMVVCDVLKNKKKRNAMSDIKR